MSYSEFRHPIIMYIMKNGYSFIIYIVFLKINFKWVLFDVNLI